MLSHLFSFLGLSKLKSYLLRKPSSPSESPTSKSDEVSSPPAPVPPPLLYESFSKEWQQVSSQDSFDGFRIEFAKPVITKSEKFFKKPFNLLSNVSLFLGTSMTENNCFYNYGPTFNFEDGSMFLMARYNMGDQISLRGWGT